MTPAGPLLPPDPLDHARRTLLASLSETAIRRFVKFLVVGGSGVLIQAAILRLLVGGFRIDPTVSNLCAAAVAIFSNFNLNNVWTFATEKIEGLTTYLRKMASFYATSSVGVIVIQTGAIFAGDLLFGKRFYLEYFLVGTAILVAYNFSVYRLVIWRREPGMD